MFRIAVITIIYGLLFAVGIKGISEHNQNYMVISFGIMFFIAMENLWFTTQELEAEKHQKKY